MSYINIVGLSPIFMCVAFGSAFSYHIQPFIYCCYSYFHFPFSEYQTNTSNEKFSYSPLCVITFLCFCVCFYLIWNKKAVAQSAKKTSEWKIFEAFFVNSIKKRNKTNRRNENKRQRDVCRETGDDARIKGRNTVIVFVCALLT